jgi:riboflavin synthase
MFTGLIEKQGYLQQIKPNALGKSFVIRTDSRFVSELTLGESVAVNGACLTVTRYGGDHFEVDASLETLENTTLQYQQLGQGLHLERALQLGARLGGHWVTGHIDCVGQLKSIQPLGEALKLSFSVPKAQMRYVVHKGSIAIDGVSLTVNEVWDDGFSIVLIPHTQSVIHLHTKKINSFVNLETDIIGKYIEKFMIPRTEHSASEHLSSTSQVSAYSSKVDMDLLGRTGFLK